MAGPDLQQQHLSRTSSGLSVDSQQPRCRLCWGDAADVESGRLISPCNCKGSMQYIHLKCLKHWLEVNSQQGRRRALRCEICKAKYRDARSLQADGELLPSVLHDPYAIASLLHGALRAYVAISGMLQAYNIYKSIKAPTSSYLQAPGRGSYSITRKDLLPADNSGSSASSASSSHQPKGSRLWRTRQQQPQQPHHALQQQQQHRAPFRHLCVSIPVGGNDADLLQPIRERFDKATMVQVYWYTALLALTPQPPNADAFTGMAIGAAVGGMIAQLVFMPIMGSGKLAAVGHSCKLLLQCLLRLMAAEACQARGYRLLAAAVRAVMQSRWRLQLRQQLRRILLSPLVGLGWLIGAAPPDAQVLQAAAGLEVLLQQQHQDAQ